MNTVKRIFTILLTVLCFSSVTFAQVVWDFEDGNDHGFTLRCQNPATPAADDPATAGDEALTGGWEEGNPNNLPEAGVAWVVAWPDSFFGLLPGAKPENARVNTEGVMDYSLGTARIGDAFTGSLNTYLLNMYGDYVHTPENDQIATSPPVLLGENAEMTVWSSGGGGDIAPEFDADPTQGYKTESCGIAVLSAADNSLLTSLLTNNKGSMLDQILDLSAFSGQEVIIEVVDAFDGSWGWLAVDEIDITNATLVETAVEERSSASPAQFKLAQNFPNPFNPSTRIQYTLGTSSEVEITVYDLLGNNVATLVKDYQSSGSYHVVWDASDAAAGVYLYQLKANNMVETKKMLLVK